MFINQTNLTGTNDSVSVDFKSEYKWTNLENIEKEFFLSLLNTVAFCCTTMRCANL